MLSTLVGAIKRITVGNELDQETDGEEDANDDAEIEIPMIRTGISTNRNAPIPDQEENKENDEEIETFKGNGSITALDLSMGIGVIDRMYQFDTEKFCAGDVNYQKGTKVEFEAEKPRAFPQWKVISMKLYVSDSKTDDADKQRYRTVVALVKSASIDDIEVAAGKENKDSRTIRIPILKELEVGFKWVPGDWVQIGLENILAENDLEDDLPACITRSKILSLAPLEMKTVVGKVTKRHNNCLIDDSIYYTEDVCDQLFPIGAAVRCIAIKSTQCIGSDYVVSWRATEVHKSSFMHYTCPEATFDKETYKWKADEATMDTLSHYRELLNDKFGIQISPRVYLNFPPSFIGSSALKNLTIRNISGQTFRLRKILMNQSVSQFQIHARQQERDGSLTFLPGDEVVFDVICCPSIMGKTKELCVFDFGDFVIGREFTATGRSEDEHHLKVDNMGAQRPNFKKQIGEQDLSKIMTDRDRRRVRGSQTVRAPFFSQKRLPLNKVPNGLYEIMKKQDEKDLLRMFPNVLSTLRYENYLVSLWFEEIENDLRRRQYDLSNVRLIKHFADGTPCYKFDCPGILDFQPPVNLQDTVDAFDADNPETAKFQGTVLKINDNEVTCVFGDAFNQQYTGFPLTIQFNLGRTNYKRCHFAIQTAVEHLGEDFLFPEDDIQVKNARISTYEDDTIDGDAIVAEAYTSSSASAKTNGHGENSIFRKATPAPIFRSGPASASTSNSEAAGYENTGRRAKSLRSRFVSNTASSPSTSKAKLEWFNTDLNQEQKNAVRCILHGQARPLPYIIFGPPGTGKTVTLVEAIMQVNKLDSNSRILVCAPSNAAADVIGEYLISSRRYYPGDFIRFNGYLRCGQTISETLAEYCVDGNDLNHVAMHKLIICTCMTAGQFFSLDLSLGHFTHVFVDEAGYCTEPETMVPAILLAKSKGGQLILAGDHNQLGPVLMSDVSQNCGLNISFLERLMKRHLYMRDPERFKEKYNSLVLTKLVKNYRAHRSLLKLPSKLFYDDDLIPQAVDDEHFLNNENVKKLLVKPGVPLIFDGVQGSCTRERDSPSWCNVQEAMTVARYVQSLVRSCGVKCDDIGIITPYRKQVEKIRAALYLNLSDTEIPKVASVEEFQGGERKIIIISTVRSVNEEHIEKFVDRLGFLYQPKRFNVVITRAKSLMIVVGNPHVLARNKFWHELLSYATKLGAYTGCNLPIFLSDSLGKLVMDKSSNKNEGEASTKNETASVVQQGTEAIEPNHHVQQAVEEFQDCADEEFDG